MKRFVAFFLFAATTLAVAQAPRPILLGYVRGPNHLIAPGEINARKLTRIHYAFLHPQDGIVAATSATDDANLRTLVALKQQNPSLEVLISVGGGAHSMGFSELALTAASRAKFVASCMELIAKYSLDGIDIDWEYPGSAFPGHTTRREEDKTDYTLLFHDLREAFDTYEQKTHHKHLLLSTATNGKPFFIRATDLGAASAYLDTVALMGYDVYGPNSATTGNHSPLLTDPADPSHYSDDSFIRAYVAAGVPAAKIVLGVPFYGFVWLNVPPTNSGLFQAIPKGSAHDESYAHIVQTELASGSGFKRVWDEASKVPTLYNAATHTFISYEDPESLAAKAAYVREHGLAGMMFWEYSGDFHQQLLDAIDLGLNPATAGLARPRTP
jgi:chitinase